MAALPHTRLTLADLAKYMDPSGRVQPVVEMLEQRNEILKDPMWMPGNLPTGHQFSLRAALPTASLRDFNQGVAPSVSAVAQQTEGMSLIEAWSEVDEAEANLNGEAAAFRAGEDAAFIQTLEQTVAQLMIYGNHRTDSKEFNGMATRVSTATNPNFVNCTGVAGSLNTSFFVADWGPNLFMTYPKGSEAGLSNKDLGEVPIQFADGTRMLALMSQYTWKCGMVARDHRSIQRVGNIEVAALRARTGTQAITASTNVIYGLIDAIAKLPTDGSGNRAIYMNRTGHTAMTKMAYDRTQNVLDIHNGVNQFGKAYTWTSFMGIPLRCVDKILNTEAQVV